MKDSYENTSAVKVARSRFGSNDILKPSLTEFRDRIKIKSRIGSGGFADVYKATLDGSPVALKVLRSRKVMREQVLMFMQEARALKASKHRHIVEFVKLVELPKGMFAEADTSRWAIVQELMQLGSLSKLVAQQMHHPGRQLYTTYQAVEWLRQIASALAHLHSQPNPVIHRDVKLDNIMLTKDSDGAVLAKLGDFGLQVTLDACRKPVLRKSASCPMVNRLQSLMGMPRCGSNGDLVQYSASSLPIQRANVSSLAVEASPTARSPSFVEVPQNGRCGQRYSASRLSGLVHEQRTDSDNGSPNSMYHSGPESASLGLGALRHMVHALHGNTLAQSTGQPLVLQLGHVDGGDVYRKNDDLEESVLVVGSSYDSNAVLSEWEYSPSISDTDFELVFNLTGRTGSCLYMAPEVFNREAYNQQADVFSFGIVMYELLSRSLVALKEVPKGRSPEEFAERVSHGYRPSCTSSIPPELWELIDMCWDSEARARPDMALVCQELTVWLANNRDVKPKACKFSAPREPGCGCVIS